MVWQFPLDAGQVSTACDCGWEGPAGICGAVSHVVEKTVLTLNPGRSRSSEWWTLGSSLCTWLGACHDTWACGPSRWSGLPKDWPHPLLRVTENPWMRDMRGSGRSPICTSRGLRSRSKLGACLAGLSGCGLALLEAACYLLTQEAVLSFVHPIFLGSA